MKRRSFLKSLALLAGASALPVPVFPLSGEKTIPLPHKRRGKIAVRNPEWVNAKYGIRFFVIPGSGIQALVAENGRQDEFWKKHLPKGTRIVKEYLPIRFNEFSSDGKPLPIAPYRQIEI